MNTYAEVKAGTQCSVWTEDRQGGKTTYPENDLLKVTSETKDYVYCGSLGFRKSDVQLLKPL